MRGIWSLLALLVPLVAMCQPTEEPETDPTMVAPDVIINVQEHKTTADIVTISLRKRDYPPQLLIDQIKQMGVLLGVPPRGTYINRFNLDQAGTMTALKATFTIDGIIDREGGKLNLEALVKPFLGAPEPNVVKSFMITFDGEKPGSKTLKSLRTGNVRVAANVSEAPLGLEYRILTLTQNPDDVVIPTSVEQTPAEIPSRKPSSKRSPFIIPLAIGAGVAGIALVYFALLKRPGRR